MRNKYANSIEIRSISINFFSLDLTSDIPLIFHVRDERCFLIVRRPLFFIIMMEELN